MDQDRQERDRTATVFSDWVKTSTDFWMSLAKMTPATADAFSSPPGGAKGRSLESWETATKMLRSLSSTLSEPEMADTAWKGVSALPEVFFKLAQATWDASLKMQKQTMERAGKRGQQVEAYNFDNLDQEMLRTLTDIYETEFRKFYHIPQLGLTRFYQEKYTSFLDSFNLFEATFAEFMVLLSLPFEKSFKVMQQKLEVLIAEGKVPQESKEYYNMWIKILEGHYMTLFKSPAYNKSLADILNRMAEFIMAKNEVLQDVFQSLPIPTYKEMDELYKELHLLKKRVRDLEGQSSGR